MARTDKSILASLINLSRVGSVITGAPPGVGVGSLPIGGGNTGVRSGSDGRVGDGMSGRVGSGMGGRVGFAVVGIGRVGIVVGLGVRVAGGAAVTQPTTASANTIATNRTIDCFILSSGI